MEENKNEEKKKLGVPATILLAIVATLGIMVLIGIVYALITIL